MRSTAKVRTLLVSDLVDSTWLVEQLGDARTAEVFAQHDRLARDLMCEHGGLEIDKTDGFLVLFERPLKAVLYAFAYHRSLEELSAELEIELASRVGIHLGEVLLDENSPDDVARGAKPVEVHGLAKPMAARLMSLARGRQTLLTQAAFDVARRAMVGSELPIHQLSWLAHGAYRFKGVEEATEVFEVGVPGFSPLAAPDDPRRAQADNEDEILGWRPARGQTIPDRPKWLLDSKLGDGGFGEVWLARHPDTDDTRVFKFCFDAERLRGLKREITIFRLLKETLGHRDDIVRMRGWQLDAPPYHVESDYAPGGDIAEWAESRNGLLEIPLAVRVDIVAQIADALSAAHSVGVLHKDVKPANVLVRDPDAETPRVQLTDFGVGMATDRARLAQAGITVRDMTVVTPDTSGASGYGTMIYVAPEILEGETATVQADVYSIGVLLYQAVAGDFRRTLAPGWERDVEDDLLREDIALAVDRSPARRLSSAHELAERLRSLEARRMRLAAEREATIEARRARVALARSRRRRKLAVAVSVVAVLFAGAMGVQSWRVAREAKRAASEAEAARRVTEFMVDLFEVSDPGEARGNTITAREILENGALRIDHGLESQPLAKARLMDTIGRVYGKLGLYGQATMLLERALATRRASGADLLEIASSLNHIGSVYWHRGLYAEAEPFLTEALAIREAQRGANHPDVARVLDNLGSLYEIQARYSEAERLHQRALAIREKALGPDHLEVASTLDDLAVLHIDQGQYADAEALSRRGLEIRERALGADHPDVATSLNGLAIICAGQDRFDEAVELFRRALDVRRKVHQGDHDSVAQSLYNLGFALLFQGEVTQAEEYMLDALAMRERKLGGEHRSVAQNLQALAGLYANAGRDDEAEDFFRRAVETWKAALGESHPSVADALSSFAGFYRSRSRPRDAEPLLREALATLEQGPEPQSTELADALTELATLLREVGRAAEAIPLERRAEAIGIAQ